MAPSSIIKVCAVPASEKSSCAAQPPGSKDDLAPMGTTALATTTGRQAHSPSHLGKLSGKLGYPTEQ